MGKFNVGILFWKVMGKFNWETSSLFLWTRYSFLGRICFLKAMLTHWKTVGLLGEHAILSKEKNGKRIFFHLHGKCLMSILFSKLILLFAFSVVGKSSQNILPDGGFMAISYGTIRKTSPNTNKYKSSIFGGSIILTHSHMPPLNMTKNYHHSFMDSDLGGFNGSPHNWQ